MLNNAGITYNKNIVYCSNITKKRTSDACIRGNWNKEYIKYQIKMSKMFKISKATIRDIVARRSWNK